MKVVIINNPHNTNPITIIKIIDRELIEANEGGHKIKINIDNVLSLWED